MTIKIDLKKAYYILELDLSGTPSLKWAWV